MKTMCLLRRLNDCWRKKHTTNLRAILETIIHKTVQKISENNTDYKAIAQHRVNAGGTPRFDHPKLTHRQHSQPWPSQLSLSST